MDKTCSICGQNFEITDRDLAFLQKISPVFGGKTCAIPPPTFCPACRQRRRYYFRNERSLYRRTCDLTGKPIVSMYAPDKAPKVYDQTAWWGDGWSGLEYGAPIDFSRPFFEQFAELYRAVPHLALVNVQCENSDFVNQCGWSKNCYMAFVTDFSEDCYYTDFCYASRSCMDSSGLHDCELCYGCVDCMQCYQMLWSQDCDHCHDCAFCSDCKECANCFGCTALRKKEYCFFNEQLSAEEWKRRMRELSYTHESIEALRKRAGEVKMHMPHPHAVMANCVDSTGNYLSNCKNAVCCFDGKNIEDGKYCVIIPQSAKDSQDMIGGVGELLYEVFSTGPGTHNCFCIHCWNNVSDLLYCAFCMNGTADCFGCMGLRKARYCILNTQYTKEEYEMLVPKIIDHMRKTGEWGEFFPAGMSPFGYNETVAQDHYPLSEKEARERGFVWQNVKDEIPKAERVVAASQLPGSIGDVPDDILRWVIECEASKRPFRVIKQELEFYRRMGLPVPRLHPDERYKRRAALRNPRKLWSRTCAQCGKKIETSYTPDRPEIVYCQDCYLKEVY